MVDENTAAPEGEKGQAEAQPPQDPPQAKPSLLGRPEVAPEGDKAEPNADPKKEEQPYELELPEGFEANEERLKEFKSFAAKSGLEPKTATEVLKFYQQQQKIEVDQLNKQVEEWEQKITSKPGYEKDLALAKRFVAKYADDETKALLDTTWIGSHPGMLNLIVAAGKLIQEEKIVDAPPPSKREVSADDFFPSMRKK